ncbi:Halomucin [Frankliniella fusca]|uniref:Halomucin n=1 Tax=Frankliniella fusca TaxID=407009 RepID=A0AAE1H7T7_9NEOP|nr:Halomucin [Frankliniella fusca]
MEPRSRFRKWYTRRRRETDDRQVQSSDESEVELPENQAAGPPASNKRGRFVSSESSSSERIQSNDENDHGNESNSDSKQSQGSVRTQDSDNLRRDQMVHQLDLNGQQEPNGNDNNEVAVGGGSGEESDVNSDGSGEESHVNSDHGDNVGGNDLDNSFSSASGGSDNSEPRISSEEDATSEDEGEENLADDMPLFPGAHLTLRQSLLSILTFSITHKLSGVCIADLLSLIALHCGPNEIGLKTLYRFKSYFSMIGKKSINCYYYCSVCEILLPNQNTQCQNCLGRHEVAYFLSFPIVDQLKVMYSREGFRESLNFKRLRRKKNEDNLEDIYDGKIYQEQINNGFLANPDNISFFMYFDGVSLFKSSKFSIWPLYLSINELKFQDRVKKENVVLAGLWFGKSKPNPNLILSPLVDQMWTLEREGAVMTLARGGQIRVRGKIIGAVADLPAKALFMRMTQYNGRYSCFNCMSSGGRFDMGNNTIQVFPYSRIWEPRNEDEMVDFAEQAVEARRQDPDASVYGIRGPTLMLSL